MTIHFAKAHPWLCNSISIISLDHHLGMQNIPQEKKKLFIIKIKRTEEADLWARRPPCFSSSCMQIIMFNVAQNGKQWSNLSIFFSLTLLYCINTVGFVDSTVWPWICTGALYRIKEFFMHTKMSKNKQQQKQKMVHCDCAQRIYSLLIQDTFT